MEINKLTPANTTTQNRYPTAGRMVEKYSLQQLKSPTQVFRQAMKKIIPSRIIPALPNRLSATNVKILAPFPG